MRDDSATAVLAQDPRSLLGRIVRVMAYVAKVEAGHWPADVAGVSYEAAGVSAYWRAEAERALSAAALTAPADEVAANLEAVRGVVNAPTGELLARMACAWRRASPVSEGDLLRRALVGAWIRSRGSARSAAALLLEGGSRAGSDRRRAVAAQIKREAGKFAVSELGDDAAAGLDLALACACATACAVADAKTIGQEISGGRLLAKHRAAREALAGDAALIADIEVGALRLQQVRANLLAGRSPFAPAAPASRPAPSASPPRRAARGRPPKIKLTPKIAHQLETA